MRLNEIGTEFETELIDKNLNMIAIKTEGGVIQIMERSKFSPAKNSIFRLFVEPEYRNKGIGDKLIKEAMRRYSSLGVQCSSPISLHLFYKNGFRSLDNPGATLEDLAKEFETKETVFVIKE